MCNPSPQGTQWELKQDQTPAASRPELLGPECGAGMKEDMASTPRRGPERQPASTHRASRRRRSNRQARAPRPHPGRLGRHLIALVAFIVGGIGLVVGSWTLFWVGRSSLSSSSSPIVATVVLHKMGIGAV